MFEKILSRLKSTPSESGRLVMAHHLPEDREQIVLSMLDMFPKLILTGSTSLYISGLMDYRMPHDIDFGLKAPMDDYELNQLMDFFKLIRIERARYEPEIAEELLKKGNKIITLVDRSEKDKKTPLFQAPVGGYGGVVSTGDSSPKPKIDIFKGEYVSDRDIVELIYKPKNQSEYKIIDMVHPSVPLSYKSRYVFDPRVKEKSKHEKDLSEINDRYFKIIGKVRSKMPATEKEGN